MSGFKEKTWKKWKETKTISPVVAVTDKKSTDSITSQGSSSLIRSKKRDTTRNAANNILAAENQGRIKPRTPVDNGGNKRATINNKDYCDAEKKNDFRNKSTSPFNTLAPTNPFYRENVIIVQYGELKENNALDAQESDEFFDARDSADLWDELPSTDVAESTKPTRKKGPKGGSRHPTTVKKSHHEPTAPPASPANEIAPAPAQAQAPAQAPPQTALGPSSPSGSPTSHGPVPQSGLSHPPRTTPSSGPGTGTCDLPECPARGPKQKERLCMAPECPVTLKKTVVKEAKKAMKRSNGKKRRNPLTILGAALMSTFAGRDSSCKLTKEEKRALKRMKQAEEDDEDDYNTPPVKAKKSRGVQCKAPILQKSERAREGPGKADKSTVCDIPKCPIAIQKTKIKEFMDKGQLCDIPSCPVKGPPPRKEKKVATPKGCPSKPCTLKTKDEEFLKQLDPSIFEKLPRLKMTCEQALAEENGGQSRSHHTPSDIKHKDKPSSNKTKEKNKEVKIVAAHVRVPPSSRSHFLPTIPNPQEFPASNKLTGPQVKQNQHNSEKASECHKLVDRRLSTSAFVSEAESDEFKSPNSKPLILSQKKASIIGTEDKMSGKQAHEVRFPNVSVNQKSSHLGPRSAAKISETIGSRLLYLIPNKSGSAKSGKTRPGESIESKIKPIRNIDAVPHRNRLTASKTLLASENKLKSSFSSKSSMYPVKTDPESDQTIKDKPGKKSVASFSISRIAESKEIEIKPTHGSAELGGIMQDFPVPRSDSLIYRLDFVAQKYGPLNYQLLPVVPVNHPSSYDTRSNKVLEDPFDLPTPTESSGIQLPERNWNTPKNSANPIAGETTSLPSSSHSRDQKEIERVSNCVSREKSVRENSEQISIRREKFIVREFDEPVVNYSRKKSDRKIFAKYSNYVADNEMSLSQNPAIRTVSGDRFNEKIHEPLIVEQSASGKKSDENRSKKMPLNVFVAELITASPPTKSKPESEPVQCLFKAMPATENVARVCSTQRYVTAKPSGEIRTRTPVISLHVCQDTRNNIKPQNDMILDRNTSESLKRDGRTCSYPSVEHGAATGSPRNPIIPNQVTVSTAQRRKFDDSKASNETYTQTLATSAVSPNELNTIGVGDSAIVDLDSKILASQLR